MRAQTVRSFVFALLLGTASPNPPARAQLPSDHEPSFHEPSGLLTFQEALALALLRNPELQAFSFELRAAEARRLQASLRPNPELKFELENATGSLPGLSSAEMTLSVGQLVELGGKRKARTEAARSDQAVLDTDYEARRLFVISEVTQRFIEALAHQRALTFADEALQTAGEVETAASHKVQAGAVSPAEKVRAGVELARARLEREGLAKERDLAYVRLAALWASSRPRFSELAGAIDSTAAVPALDTLLARVDRSPAVARWEEEVRARERRLRIERSARVPDLEVEAGYRSLRDTGDHTFVAGLSVPLNFFNRNQGNIAAARALLSQGETELGRARLQRSVEITEAYTALTREQARIGSLRADILPGAQRAFEEIRTGYQRGRFSYLDLLEARRTWIDARRDELTALVTFHRTRAEIERLIGGPLTVSPATNGDSR
jgi:cobalt-zinc-cadmium efflux system outer membrane protein